MAPDISCHIPDDLTATELELAFTIAVSGFGGSEFGGVG
jgi:hypothetical protein